MSDTTPADLESWVAELADAVGVPASDVPVADVLDRTPLRELSTVADVLDVEKEARARAREVIDRRNAASGHAVGSR